MGQLEELLIASQQSTSLRVDLTPEAGAVIRKLVTIHGPLMFHQSGGCCDGSAPMCYPAGEFRVGRQDVLLGYIEGCEFWMGADQFVYWEHTHLTLDVVKGRGSGFSVEAPEGVRFIIRSRLYSDEEWAVLSKQPVTHGG